MEKLEPDVHFMSKYGTDLTKLAQEGKLDPMIEREQQLNRVIQILGKKRKNNPCLIGDLGVGKTAIVEGLAQGIVDGTVPDNLKNRKMFSVEMSWLVAGTTYRSEFEERLKNLIDEVKSRNGEIIVFIDELHTVIGAGTGGASGGLDAANIMKPALARGELMCIGATTRDEYRRHIEKDGALQRRFQPVEVLELTVEETVEVLKRLSPKYEHHHNVYYEDEALTAAAHLTKQYISNQFLPDKAIDLMDEVGSYVQLKILNSSPEIPQAVGASDVQHTVSTITGIPVENVPHEESFKLMRIEGTLKKRVKGQDVAVEAVCRAIRRSRVGRRDPNRPISSLLFTGPTGVGKTELAKELAMEYFGSREAMIRLDMREYAERHMVSKLFGSPPGYVRYSDGGQLTNAVGRKPHALILLDEIEKAHRDIFYSFLQVLDDGRLTDNKGRTIDFSNTLIVMTSNIGNNVVGSMDSDGDVANELKKHFRLEFLNRIDEIVVFGRLNQSHLDGILNAMLGEVKDRLLRQKNIKLSVGRKLRADLIKEGYHPSYGARSLRRTVTRRIEDCLADWILDGSIKEWDTVILDMDGSGKTKFSKDVVGCFTPKFRRAVPQSTL